MCATAAACPARSGRGLRRRVAHFKGGAVVAETPANLLRDVELAAAEGPCPSDRLTGAAIARGLGFEEGKHPLGAVRRPR